MPLDAPPLSHNPPTPCIAGKIMFIVAACGLVINIALMKVLHQGECGAPLP